MIDPAIMRPGRVDRHVEVEIPDEEGRRKIFEVHTRDMPVSDDVNLEELGEMTEGYVGSDIESVCREAGMNALRSDIDSGEATMEEFEEAIADVRPTATSDNLEQYRAMTQKMNEMETDEDDTPDYYA
ncbi:MAG: hypothetical protein BRC30_01800 [Nanohaloarchaea archaeon SW_7_46_7]|nr:MAG: hypothetical protein BRC30_01800 [Nanohaloarchaea archaeon SW_7_46_7]